MRAISQVNFRYLLIWSVLVTVGPFTYGQDRPGSEIESPKYEIVANGVHKTARSRSIYIYLDKSGFTLDSVSRVVDQIDKQFCEPFALRVTIFSDRQKLEWYMKGVAADFIDFDYSTAEGRKGAAEYLAKIYPPPTGYLRAYYYRTERWEYFDFSPAADLMEMKLIVIANTDGSLKADGYAKFPKSACILGNGQR